MASFESETHVCTFRNQHNSGDESPWKAHNSSCGFETPLGMQGRRICLAVASHILLCVVGFCVLLQAVTCSGCSRDGSLRVIRSGIGINEQVMLVAVHCTT